ncbi:MAG: hypothetical protein ACKO5F_12920 [Synechococcus sp.]
MHPSDSPSVPQPSGTDPRRQALIDSLRQRHQAALEQQDDAARQDLFREAAYLGILPEEFQEPPAGESTPGG